MSKFKVGDRVRIVWSPDQPALKGTETTIVEILGSDWEKPSYKRDAWYAVALGDPDNRWCFPTRALKPIYDGNDKVSWSECAWQPRSIKVC